jgi:hypothetical protein
MGDGAMAAYDGPSTLAGGEQMGVPWTVPLLLLAATVLLALLPFGRRLFSGSYRSRRTFWCPVQGTNVGVDFKTAIWDGMFVHVDSCSAMAAPVSCRKDCLLLGNHEPLITPGAIAMRRAVGGEDRDS